MTSPHTSPPETRDARARSLIGRWSRDDMPDLAGHRVLVTGGTRGLGRATVLALAARGASVTLTGTSLTAAQEAAATMDAQLAESGMGRGSVSAAVLDLTDLTSVAALAQEWHGPLDLLINNAGIMWGPFAATPGGVERQLATHFLGHFALVGHLVPRLVEAPTPRVVSLSSTYHAFGGLTPEHLDPTPARYRPTRAYGTSKLAMLSFARELGRRADRAGLPLTSVAAHPGYADTSLQTDQLSPLQGAVMRVVNRALAVPVEAGADPVLCAATVADLPSGTFVGPSRLGGYRGRPGVAASSAGAEDPELAKGLWSWAEGRAGVRYLDAAA